MPAENSSLFALRKHWYDPSPGIEVVELRYVLSRPGEAPVWIDEESRVLVPRGDGPLFYRSAAILLPRGLDELGTYALHSYYLIVQQGRQRSTLSATEEIVYRTLRFRSVGESFVPVGAQWSVGDTVTPNYSAFVKVDPVAHSVAAAPVWGPRGSVAHFAIYTRRNEQHTAGRWVTNGITPWQQVL